MKLKLENSLVTIIMPAYNCAPYVSKAIKSVLNQSYSNIELLVIEDCSTDNTRQVLEQINLEVHDKRLHIYYSDKNRGVSHARNIGLQNARGKYFTFIDSDDWVDNEYIEQLIKSLSYTINQDIKPLVVASYIEEYQKLSDIVLFDLYTLCTISDISNAVALLSCPWGKLYQTEFLKLIDLQFDETQKTGVEDIQFVLKYLLKLDNYIRNNYQTPCTVYYNRNTRLHWRQNETGLTATKDAFMDILRVFNDLYSFVLSTATFTDIQRSEYLQVVHKLYIKQVNNWHIKRTIRLKGSYRKAIPDLVSLDLLTGIDHMQSTIKAFETYLKCTTDTKHFSNCLVFLIDTKSTSTDDLAYSPEHVENILKHIDPNTKWKVKTIYTAARNYINSSTSIELLDIQAAIDFMKLEGMDKAIIIDPVDYIRSQYFNDFQSFIESTTGSVCLIPESRTQVNGTTITTEVNKDRKHTNLKDLIGCLIMLRDTTDLQYIQTDNLNYVQNYYLVN